MFSCSSATLNSLFHSIPLFLGYLSVNQKWLLHWTLGSNSAFHSSLPCSLPAALSLLSREWTVCGESRDLSSPAPYACSLPGHGQSKGQGVQLPLAPWAQSYTFLVPTPNCLIDSQWTKAEEIMRRGTREIISQIKWWSSFSFSFLYLLPSLSSTSGCKRPNLEPPDCIKSIHRSDVKMKLNFWAITWIFSLGGEVGNRPHRWHPHTQRAARRGTRSLAVKGWGAGSCFCHSEGVLMEATSVALDVFESRPALGLSCRSCYREGSTLQRSRCMTLTCNDSRCTL